MLSKLNPEYTIPCKYYTFYAAIVIVCILGYSLYLTGGDFQDAEKAAKAAEDDPLNKTVVDIGIDRINGWSVSHIMYYIGCGFIFPGCWKLFIGLGIGWEIFETIAGHYYKKNLPEDKLNTGKAYDVFWEGRWSDLAMNTIGFLIGVALRILVEKTFIDKKK